MRFQTEEIQLAMELHDAGIDWHPAVGDYVYDATGAVTQPSPFQNGVYFILNRDYFMTLLGGVEQFRMKMVRLPTWEQVREIVRSLGFSDDEIAQHLNEHRGIESGQERLLLYRLAVHAVDARQESAAS